MQLQDIIQSTQCCISDLKDWMTNRLQLNEDKTEMILISANKVLNNTPLPSEVYLNGTNIKLSQTVRNLGVTLDQTISFQQRISNVCRTCYLELRRISTIRHYIPEEVTKTLICAFVLSRLDYCNALVLDRLLKIQNNAARLIYWSPKFSHVTRLFHTLHWLPIEKKD